MDKIALMVLAEKPFRDPEYFEPKKVLESAGVKVVTASTGPVAYGAEGAQVKADILLDKVKAEDYDAIIFIGGTGSYQYHNDPKAHELARYAVKPGKVLGSICASVGTLAKAGVLKGKKATGDPGVAEMIKAGGANYTGGNVETDGNIITAKGRTNGKEFGEALAKALTE